MLKLKEQERATFFSPADNWCLPASNLKLEEREFVVDSDASMHMMSKKDLSNDEIVQSYDSQPPMERCRRTKRQRCMSKNWIYS